MSDRHRERDPQWATRALQEFMAVPLLMIAGFVALAVITIVLDQSHADWLHGARRALEHLVGQGAAQSSLSAIATGLVTVTSITFSVLLLAVQQAAASLSPVVFDQFVRRRVNQVYVGFFVGLSIYSYVVLAAVQKDTPPTLGASLAVLLTVIALFILLALVYSTLNQMRPVNVIRAIRAHALNARSGELELLGRTRREARQSGPPDATVTAPVSGYVMSVALAGIGPVLERTPEAELELAVVLGDYVSAGQPVGFVRGAGPDGERLAAAAAHCVVIGKQRDPDVDPANRSTSWRTSPGRRHHRPNTAPRSRRRGRTRCVTCSAGGPTTSSPAGRPATAGRSPWSTTAMTARGSSTRCSICSSPPTSPSSSRQRRGCSTRSRSPCRGCRDVS